MTWSQVSTIALFVYIILVMKSDGSQPLLQTKWAFLAVISYNLVLMIHDQIKPRTSDTEQASNWWLRDPNSLHITYYLNPAHPIAKWFYRLLFIPLLLILIIQVII